MKTRRIFWGIFRVATSLASAVVALAIAFHLTAILFDRVVWHPPALVVQIINSLLALFFMVLVVAITGLLFHLRRGDSRPGGPFAPIISALERIAKGDFSARLDDSRQKHGPVRELVHTFNNMVVQLDQMEKMRQEFISNVSHEIQSPLTSIHGFACALQQDGLSAGERRRYLEIIEAESLRLSKLSANLLKLASLEPDQLKFEPKPFRLDTQIRNLILACEPQWAAKDLVMDAALDETLINADEELLGQVWINLIHNSIKFTPAGGSVRVELRREPEHLEVRIADNGIGIADEDQPHIFERFYKADPSRRPSGGGSGLGLSIAKKVVELHRGAIAVRSQLGTGTTFTVDLPLQ